MNTPPLNSWLQQRLHIAVPKRATRLPTPGLAYGDYPQRRAEPDSFDGHRYAKVLRQRLSRQQAPRLPDAVQAAYLRALQGLSPVADLAPAAARLRGHLRREGLSAARSGQALALTAVVMQRTQGLQPYDTQVLAAWLMLQGHLVEMATGEGKTLAAALAAAVAALAGTPVHVLTANDYLVQRDQLALAPFYAALGLGSACITSSVIGPERNAAWRSEVVYTTASQLTFDYLRDHVALNGERDARLQQALEMTQAVSPPEPASDEAPTTTARLPGLCLCLVDEADSVLLDEAVVPLLLAAPGGELDSAAYQRAYTLASGLQRQRDYQLHTAQRRATLTLAGRASVQAAVAGAGGELHPPRRACELVEAALAARLLYHRDREYVLVAQELHLIDELTGRLAIGRQWQGALHPMVQIKEGLAPSPPTRVAAQITYQRFFPRYLHLAGMSGTLSEARRELSQLYGAAVYSVPLARPSRRRWLGQRCYADATSKWQAVVQTVAVVAAHGRPVLIGTDSVGASAHLSQLLQAAGVQHQVLNAAQDSDEAQTIARAGQAGCVTVATNMAGRGTDIRLDEAAAAAGGLHVIATMRNRSGRIDRQLLGRAARHGDPGSAECIVALDDSLLSSVWPPHWLAGLQSLLRPLTAVKRSATAPGRQVVHPVMAQGLFALTQYLAAWRDREHRRELRHADEQANEVFGFSGGTE